MSDFQIGDKVTWDNNDQKWVIISPKKNGTYEARNPKDPSTLVHLDHDGAWVHPLIYVGRATAKERIAVGLDEGHVCTPELNKLYEIENEHPPLVGRRDPQTPPTSPSYPVNSEGRPLWVRATTVSHISDGTQILRVMGWSDGRPRVQAPDYPPGVTDTLIGGWEPCGPPVNNSSNHGQDSIPRRIRRDQWTPAERAIQDAVDAVEATGCDPRLTNAVNLLAKARDCVADFIDGIETPYTPKLNDIVTVRMKSPAWKGLWRIIDINRSGGVAWPIRIQQIDGNGAIGRVTDTEIDLFKGNVK